MLSSLYILKKPAQEIEISVDENLMKLENVSVVSSPTLINPHVFSSRSKA